MRGKPVDRRLRLAVWMAAMLLLGLNYAWSNFIPPLESAFGWDRSQTSFVFTLTNIFFVVGLNVSAFLVRLLSPRKIMLLTALVDVLGLLFSAFITQPIHIYISFGVMVGLGAGMGYNIILPAAISWFREIKSVLTGLLLMIYASGALLLGTLSAYAIASVGLRVTFLSLTVLYAVVLTLAAVFTCYAPQEQAGETGGTVPEESVSDLTTAQMVRQRSFWLAVMWYICASGGGLMIYGHAAPMALEVGAHTALAPLIVGCMNVSNGLLGRLGSGIVCQKKGVHLSILLTTLFMLGANASIYGALRWGNVPLLTLGFVLIGASYGSAPSNGVNLVMDFYGSTHYSANYALYSLALIPGSLLGPGLAGSLYTIGNNYYPALLVMLVFGVAGLALVAGLRRPAGDAAEKRRP